MGTWLLVVPTASSVTHVTPSNLGDKNIGMDICDCIEYKISQAMKIKFSIASRETMVGNVYGVYGQMNIRIRGAYFIPTYFTTTSWLSDSEIAMHERKAEKSIAFSQWKIFSEICHPTWYQDIITKCIITMYYKTSILGEMQVWCWEICRWHDETERKYTERFMSTWTFGIWWGDI